MSFLYLELKILALSIVIFTMIAKLLMLPLTIKQQKFTKLSSVMNPELQKINEKYKGKRDEASFENNDWRHKQYMINMELVQLQDVYQCY